MARHKGWDFFSADPGKVEKCECRVCGETCDVKRNVMGATSMAESMAGMKHLHDNFLCPHADEDWHKQMRSLRKEQEATKSAAIKEMLEGEIAQIYVERKPTEGWKPDWSDL